MLFPNVAAIYERLTGRFAIANEANQFFKATLNDLYEQRMNDDKFKVPHMEEQFWSTMLLQLPDANKLVASFSRTLFCVNKNECG